MHLHFPRVTYKPMQIGKSVRKVDRMSNFDGVLIGAIVAFFVGYITISPRKISFRIITLCVMIILIVVLCLLASYFGWESTILNIPAPEISATPAPEISDSMELSTPASTAINTISETIETPTISATIPNAVREETSTPVGSNIVAFVSLKEPIYGCPELNLTSPYIYGWQRTYKLTWKPFGDYDYYEVYVYELNRDDFIELVRYSASGYTCDLSLDLFEAGKSYSVNISVEGKHFSAPIIISMLPL